MTFNHLKKRGFVNLVPRAQTGKRAGSDGKDSARLGTQYLNTDTKFTNFNAGEYEGDKLGEPNN